MIIERQVFTGKNIRLGEIDYDINAQVEADWVDSTTSQQNNTNKAPRSKSSDRLIQPSEVIEPSTEEKKHNFYFTIRLNEGYRLLGFVRLNRIEWTHKSGNLWLLIGNDADRNRGYGTEALNLILKFAFSYLNLHHLNAWVRENNAVAVHFLEKAGFREKVRHQQTLNITGESPDYIQMGLQKQDWVQLTQLVEFT